MLANITDIFLDFSSLWELGLALFFNFRRREKRGESGPVI
jgi:hypothetical protein